MSKARRDGSSGRAETARRGASQSVPPTRWLRSVPCTQVAAGHSWASCHLRATTMSFSLDLRVSDEQRSRRSRICHTTTLHCIRALKLFNICMSSSSMNHHFSPADELNNDHRSTACQTVGEAPRHTRPCMMMNYLTIGDITLCIR